MTKPTNNPLDEVQLPYTVEDLIDLLNKTFPERSPDLKDHERIIWYKAGQRNVVNWLLNLKKRNEENVLGSKMPDDKK